MSAPIPESHIDLLTGAVYTILTTLMSDGQPQSSMVWSDISEEYIMINTALERQKSHNMRRNPKVSLLIIDPANGDRWLSVQGKVVAFSEEGAEAHADKLTRQYTGKAHFYGDIYPVEKRMEETRIIVKIEALKVFRDAIF